MPHIIRFLFPAVLLLFMFTGISNKATAQEIQEVGGPLGENTIWTDEFTYVVTDDLIVSSGISLEIEPGVIVKFNQGRGLIVENGTFLVNGTEADSVKFLPNHAGNDDWKWKGIVISAITENEEVSIQHAKIHKAIIGIAVNASVEIEVKNSSVSENLNKGISLINSSDCRITDCYFSGNFLGVEIFSSDAGNSSTGNLVGQNHFQGHTTALLIHNSNNGICRENVVEENLVEEGLHAIWLYKSTAGGAGNVTIRRNIIINNGNANDGYGVYVSTDSAMISHNIFWQNHQAVTFRQARDCRLENNSITGNVFGIDDRNNAVGNEIRKNTMTLNEKTVFTFSESEDLTIELNNWFANDQKSNIIWNQIPEDIDISGNYWGTTDTAAIDNLIFDKNDNPALGELNYMPFLPSADTTAPISPPLDAVMQKVGDSVLIRWKPNREADLSGYRIHFGEFTQYRFESASDIVFDTAYALEGQYWQYTVGLTALDTDANGETTQLDGNESPFAFALPMPYAGGNKNVCKSEPALQITGSTTPEDFGAINWSTQGDGIFDDSTSLNPAYFFGENDLAAMQVILKMAVTSADTVLTDSAIITLIAPPAVYAGEDAVLAPDSVFKTVEATATGFDALVWLSTGDGTFGDADMLITNYTPGEQDKLNGSVQLVLIAENASCDAVSDTLQLFIKDRFNIEGRIWHDETPVENTPVTAILSEPSGSITRSLTFTDDTGAFRFEGLFRGTYLLYAVPDTATEPVLFPSYYLGETHWDQSYPVELEGDIYGLDIHLMAIASPLPEATGRITGSFALPGISNGDLEIFCQPWFADQGELYCDGGLSNITVFLYGESGKRIYDYTLTGENGNFAFSELPFGDFTLKVELAGYQSPFSETISLTPENNTISDIQLFIGPEKKVGIFIPPTNNVAQGFLVFPNPASDKLILKLPVNESNPGATVRVFNNLGKLVRFYSVPTQTQRIELTLNGLKAGIYHGRLKQGENIRTFNFVKN